MLLLAQNGFHLVGQVGVEDLDNSADGLGFFLGLGGLGIDVLVHQIQAGGLHQLLEVVEIQQIIECGELLDQGVLGIGAQFFDGMLRQPGLELLIGCDLFQDLLESSVRRLLEITAAQQQCENKDQCNDSFHK